MLSTDICQQARLARDARFDGLFFTAVKSTGIYCRPVCPAKAPAEAQVSYYFSSAAACAAGYRPCLRCRPDSAPGSAAWQGTDTTLQRALKLIDEGALQHQNQTQLAERLGISERYLRKMFQQQLGLAPKQYAITQQVLFAKKLLHETALSVSAIAYQAGFNSVRRFNDAFKQQLQLSPGAIRRRRDGAEQDIIRLELSYRPPLAWHTMLQFWQTRTLDGIDWVNQQSYGRTFNYQQSAGWFEVMPKTDSSLQLSLHWAGKQGLFGLVQQLRRLLDLDAKFNKVEFFDPNQQQVVDVSDVWAFANTPELTATLAGKYSIATDVGEFVITANMAHRSETQIFETPSMLDYGGYTLFNAGVNWYSNDGHWDISLQGKNLGDKQARIAGYNFGVAALDTSVLGFYIDPRTVSLSVGYRF